MALWHYEEDPQRVGTYRLYVYMYILSPPNKKQIITKKHTHIGMSKISSWWRLNLSENSTIYGCVFIYSEIDPPKERMST